jgi:vancomycin resistance protein VanJ
LTNIFRAIARVTVVLGFAGAIFVATGYRLGPERFWLLALIEYLPYPLHLVPALVAVAMSFALATVWRLVGAATLGLVVWAVMGLEVHGPVDADGRLPVRVMTYNIKAHLAAARPDGFLELKRELDLHSPDILMFEDAEEAKSAPGEVAKLFDDRHHYAEGQFGIASRYPLRECAPGQRADGGRSDAYIRCTVDIEGLAVDLYAVHLRTPRQGLNATRRESLRGVEEWEGNVADRMTQSQDVAHAIRSRAHPVILGGDLNAPEVSLVVRTLLDAGLQDAFSSAGNGFGYTYGQALRPGFSFLRLDHVLTSTQIGVAACDVGGARGSEHRPVVADLLLGRGRAIRSPSAPPEPGSPTRKSG